MKQSINFVMLLLAVFAIAGCGQNDNAAPEATDVVVEQPAAVQDTPEPAVETEVGGDTNEESSDPVLVPTAEPEMESAAEPASSSQAYANLEQGIASYLSDALHGETTASGEVYDKEAYVAAHKDLPFGTEVRVTNLDNDKTVVVTIIDRMPSNNPHLIDVSYVAAVELEMIDVGNIEAKVEWDE